MARNHDKTYDVVSIDDALIDTFYPVGEAHLDRFTGEPWNIAKGTTTIEPNPRWIGDVSDDLHAALTTSGGGAANSLAAVKALGGTVAFSGKLGQQTGRGRLFREELEAIGVEVHEIPSDEPYATGLCNIYVDTETGERTMHTMLPQNIRYTPGDMNTELLDNCAIFFAQAYRWNPESKDAFRFAFDRVKAAGGKVAFSLSATFCCENNRDEFQQMIENGTIDILFGNEDEMRCLYPGLELSQLIDHFSSITHKHQTTAVLTRGAEPSIIIDKGVPYIIPTKSVARVVDATGAGDAYAAGVLHGIIHGKTPLEYGETATDLATRVIQRIGGRVREQDITPQMTVTGPLREEIEAAVARSEGRLV